MKKSEKRQQLLIAIQEYINQEGLTPSDVFRIVNEKGGGVSESSVRRICKADAEKENFSLEGLHRVSAALFGVNDRPIPVEDIITSEVAEMEALRAVASLTDSALQESNDRIASLESQLADALEKIAKLEQLLSDSEIRSQKLIDLASFRKQQMIEKDRQISRLWDMVSK